MKPALRTLLIGLGIIVITNVVALTGVAYNHSGEPEAVVELTERELPLPYRYVSAEENSGLALRLVWRVRGSRAVVGDYFTSEPEGHWLTKEKLADLGFDVSADAREDAAKRRYFKLLPRPVFVALEYDGNAHQEALAQEQRALAEAEVLARENPDKEEFIERVKRAKESLTAEEAASSRLFAIDAATDKKTLRQRYPDRGRYLILPGEVKLMVTDKGALSGYIAGLNGLTVNVPLEFRALFKPLETGDATYRYNQRPPRYSVRLAYGQRLEPWILHVTPINQPQ